MVKGIIMSEIEAMSRLMHDAANNYHEDSPSLGERIVPWEELSERSRSRYQHVATAIVASLTPKAKQGGTNSFKMPEPSEEETVLVDDVFRILGCKDPLTKPFIAGILQCVRMFDHKQQRYGCGNIAAFGEHGVLVRSHDKMARLINLTRTGQEPADETKDDTWGDLATYAIIALMCRWGWWPGVPAREAKEVSK